MSDEDYRIRHYHKATEKIAEYLRTLADEVERAARPHENPGVTGTPRFLAAAEAVNHAMTWGFANIGAYRLIESAHHADEAEREAPR